MVRLAVLLILFSLPAAAQDGTPILEFRLANADPCAGIPHVELLDRARIDAVTLTVSGNQVEAAVTGTLRCRGAAGSATAIHASTGFTASAQLSASTCAASGVQITLFDTAAATVVAEPFQARIAAVLTELTNEWADAACRGIFNYP